MKVIFLTKGRKTDILLATKEDTKAIYIFGVVDYLAVISGCNCSCSLK